MRTVSISGFGGSYEWGCQTMLQLGMRWLTEHPDFDFGAYKSYKGVYGIVTAENALAKELDEVITSGHPKLVEFGVTGAMHQAVIGHLAYLHKNGHSKWLSELAKDREAGEFFEFDGTEASCPADDSGPHFTLDQMTCGCGHKFLEHALSMDEATAKFAVGDFTAPCRIASCTCAGYKHGIQ